MKLTIFNGSPRGENSNSSIIINWFIEGYMGDKDGEEPDIHIMKMTERHSEYADILKESEIAIIVFPLYTDAMPGIVKAFIERLEPFRGMLDFLKVGYIVHSGFPEPHHSRFVENYLVRLTNILSAEYLGTAVIGGSEGFRIMPEKMTRKKREAVNELGRNIKSDEDFNPGVLKNLAPFEKMSPFKITLYKIVSLTGLTNFYWNMLIKKNNSVKDKYAKPYVIEE